MTTSPSETQEKVSIRPIRVLHDLHHLTRGGGETWLMNLLRFYRNEEIVFDFSVCEESYFDAEAKSYGATIHLIPSPYRYFQYLNALRTLLASGRYDVIHCHRPSTGGSVLKIAKALSIPCRIVHAHGTWGRGKKTLFNTLRSYHYHWWEKPLCHRHATSLLATSRETGRLVFGNDFFDTNSRAAVQFCGIDLDPFVCSSESGRRDELIKKYSLKSDCIVIGSVGALSIQKNQSFLLRVFRELVRRDSRYVLFLVGEGAIRQDLEKEARSLGVADSVVMPGVCTDVPELCCRLFNVFCLPSTFEPFGLVIIEAIAAGLHAVCSNIVTHDIVSRLEPSLSLLDLNAPLSVWADALEDGIQRRRAPSEGVEAIRRTPFSIENSAAALENIYRRDVEAAQRRQKTET